MRSFEEIALGPWRIGVQRAPSRQSAFAMHPTGDLVLYLRGCDTPQLGELRHLLEAYSPPENRGLEVSLIDRVIHGLRRGTLWAHRDFVPHPEIEVLPRVDRLNPEVHPSKPLAVPTTTSPRPTSPKPWPGDAQAQAETLERAASDGTPFCEECERLEERSPAADEAELRRSSVDNGPAAEPSGAAQARALEEASKHGSAFCEDCNAPPARSRTDSGHPHRSGSPQDPQMRTTNPVDGASPASAGVDQARTLEEAAKHGSPFCEECEPAPPSQSQ